MKQRSKRYKETTESINFEKSYNLQEAIQLLKSAKHAKFDESVDISLKLGVDPKKSDQQVRNTVLLPNGTGKDIRVVVLTKGENIELAKKAGAAHAGDAELVTKIKGGWTDFDSLIATPDMMREVGKLGKILGPRGLMPTPKAGTVTKDVFKAVEDVRKGKIEFKVDKNAVINTLAAKLSFTLENITENIESVIAAVVKAKPVTSKGNYLVSLFLSSTMGPGLKIDLNTINNI